MKYVCLSAKVQNRIETLRRSGKAGHQLVRKVNGIIESLTSGAVWYHRDAIDSYTKYGENRIRNCRKYDLGCGYRLITLQRDSTLYIPFLGTHDACQRWLENHSRMKAPAMGKGSFVTVPSQGRRPAGQETGDPVVTLTADEDVTESEPSDRELRYVFRGLVDEPAKSHKLPGGE